MSVVIPLYNKAAYIESCLRSVQSQSCRDLEIVVVDDGSTDGGAVVVEGFDDPRVILVRQTNGGAGAARNAGIAVARGQWIAFLDADDLWQPKKLARQLEVLAAHPEVAWAAGAFLRETMGGQVRQSPRVETAMFASAGVVNDALALLAVAGAIWTSTVLVRRDAIGAIEGFDPTLRVGQDRDFWVRLAVKHPRIAYIQEPIAVKREVAGSLTDLKRKEGFSTAPALSARWIGMSELVAPERSALLRALARQGLEERARQEFAALRPEKAREMLKLLHTLGLGAPSWSVRLLADIPHPILPLLVQARRTLRGLGHPANRRPPWLRRTKASG